MQDAAFQCVIQNVFNIPFRRRISPGMPDKWTNIKNSAMNIPRVDIIDEVTWSLTTNKRFSTKSVYQFVETNLAGAHYKCIWKAKLPLKIKVFMWQLYLDAVLTRENQKKIWPGSPLCSFCENVETANQLFVLVGLLKWFGFFGLLLGK
jgi:hypothetical protein